jgi:hypothetical protein
MPATESESIRSMEIRISKYARANKLENISERNLEGDSVKRIDEKGAGG